MKVFVLRNVGSSKLHYGGTVHYISFDENGRGSKFEDNLTIGSSVILDLNGLGGFTWQTTTVQEIFENTPEHMHFKTENSEYMLTKATVTNETIFNRKRHN